MIKVKILNEGFLDKISSAIKNRKSKKIQKTAMSGISAMADRLKFKNAAQVIGDITKLATQLNAFSKAPTAKQNLLSLENGLKQLLSQPTTLNDDKIQQFIDNQVAVATDNEKENTIKQQIHQEITEFVSKYAQLHGPKQPQAVDKPVIPQPRSDPDPRTGLQETKQHNLIKHMNRLAGTLK